MIVGQFRNAEVVHEYEDGWKMLYLNTVDDLMTLGTLMHHCAGSRMHTDWACTDAKEKRIVYFFVLVDPAGRPYSTIHAKQATWVGKEFDSKGNRGPTTAYDYTAQHDDRQHQSFEVLYRCPLPNEGRRPKGVDKEVWDAYVKAHKALVDNHKKKVGAIRIVGRRVKFDGKFLIILSAGGIYQGDNSGSRAKIGDFLNALGKRKKEKVAA